MRQRQKAMNHCAKFMCFVMASTFYYSAPAFADTSPSPSVAPKLSKTSSQSKCIDFTGITTGPGETADCAVSEFGSLGIFNGQTYHYSIYCLIPAYSIPEGGCRSDTFNAQFHKARAMAIFVNDGRSDTVSLLLKRAEEEIGLVWYEKPEIIKNPYGTFLYIPVHLDGTGAGNSSEYFIWDKKSKSWQTFDTKSWLDEINPLAGLSINKGIWPDLKKMSAEAYLYRKNDANCCPTGGKINIRLTIMNGCLAVKSTRINISLETQQ